MMWKRSGDLFGYKIPIAFITTFLILLLDHLGLFEGMNRSLYDVSFRLRGHRPPHKDILLIEIHEGTLRQFGRWPIRRLHFASLLKKVRQARVVVLDVILSEPTEDDPSLARAIEENGKVLLPAYLDPEKNFVGPSRTLGEGLRIGHVHLDPGTDGIVREVYHTLIHRKRVLPSISSVAYEVFSKGTFPRSPPLPTDASTHEVIIQKDGMGINYCGPPGTFDRIFFLDVLKDVYPPAFFADKIVLVGVSAIGLGDQFLTPFSESRNYMSGIEIQGNILNTLLMNNPIKVIRPWVRWSFILLLTLALYFLFLSHREKKVFLWGLIVLGGMTAILYALFLTQNLWSNPVAFYVTFATAFVMAYVIKVEEAAQNLDRVCCEMLPQLDQEQKDGTMTKGGMGVLGVLTPGGIQAKVRVLASISHRLVLEKGLVDRALSNPHHAVLLFGPDGKILLCNDLAATYCNANGLDCTTSEMFLKGIEPFVVEKGSVETSIPRQGDPAWIISFPLPQKSYFKMDVAPIEGPEGKHLLFTLFDVTQIKELEILQEHLLAQKRAEEALRESKARYDELVRRIPVGVFSLRTRKGGSMALEYGSPRFFEILKIREEALLNEANLLFSFVHPNDRDELTRIFLEVTAAVKPLRWEGRFILRGETRWIRLESDPVALPDGQSVWDGVLSDVTDRKSTEEALERAFQEIQKLKEQLEAENIYLREEVELKDGLRDIVGVSNPLKYVLHRLQQVAQSKTTVLLMGETGTGKSLFARYLHNLSDRREKPFVNVNCAALPSNLIESELFGREKGAFTGSTAKQIGRFELANGGTIFLDEISEISPELQAKLLKVIEEGEFERLGSPRSIKVDVRIIASTNRHLEEEVRNGRFREDLFYRLNVFPVTIPPLRQRKEDIPLLVKFYTEKFCRSHGKEIRRIPTGTMELLKEYSWPGNVRELINVIERAVILSAGPELHVTEKLGFSRDDSIDGDLFQGPGGQAKTLEQVEAEHILRTLNETGWKVEGPHGAAQLLGVNPSTLRARMRKLGIKRPGSVFNP